MKNYALQFRRFVFPPIFSFIFIFGLATSTFAQSTNIEFPTAVSTNEINGTIPARDLGDSRLTTFYYTFNGSQGDMFVNIAAGNFAGDIDIFYAEGLRPLSKISFYGDSSVMETGRVIYLRKSEKLILRVQGRTPDDNPATFKIKFAGSFVAVEGGEENLEPKLPDIKTDDSSGIRVNSVGTIIEVKPKKLPEIKTDATKTQADQTDLPAKTNDETVAKTAETEKIESDKSENKEVASTEEKKPEVTRKTTPAKKPVPRTTRNKAGRAVTGAANKPKPKAPPTAAENKPETTAETAENPLENVRLIVLLKNGEKIDYPMTEVFRFSMNNGILTVITKSGKIIRHPILDVLKMTVE